jgi:hypothetical protein
MLVSGRLGLDDRAMSAAWRAFAPSVQLSRADQARQSFLSRWRSGTEGQSGDLEALDAAFIAEWGYSFGDLARLIGAAVSISISNGAPVQSLPAANAAETLAREAEIAPEIAGAVLEHLTSCASRRLPRASLGLRPNRPVPVAVQPRALVPPTSVRPAAPRGHKRDRFRASRLARVSATTCSS